MERFKSVRPGWWLLLGVAIVATVVATVVLAVSSNSSNSSNSIGARASRGDADAQYQLARRYFYGDGVPEDHAVAYTWFYLSEAEIGESARSYRDFLERGMTREQIAHAKDVAAACQSNYRNCPVEHSSNLVVPLKIKNGTFVVPVLISDAITMDFTVDSGAADVSIPADVVMTLMRAGTIKKEDFSGQQIYVLADGSKVPSQTFRIRSVRVGSKVLENVNGSVASAKGSLLLGQSFLSRFKSWSIDNTKPALILVE